MSDKPQGRLARLFQLGAMTGRVAGSYVREGVRAALGNAPSREDLDRVHIENAKDMADRLSQLKGAAMKMGQQLAMFADSLDLPAEVGEALGRLNARAEPVPFEVIRQAVETELGRPLDQVFVWFDPHPLGTASLAQAHAARLPDGRDVVVKVLHQGVAESVHTDLLAFKTMVLSRASMFGRKKEEVDEVFQEIQARLEEELDYLQEAANLAAYHRAFGRTPGLAIPSVHVDLSTRRILTMDRVLGVDLDTFADMGTAAARQRAGETLVAFSFAQIFRQRMLHADPHPGNYLFGPDGTVGVLDFGCIKRFDPFFIGTYAGIALAMLDGHRDRALALCVELGAWDGVRPEAGDALWTFIEAIGFAFRQGTIRLGGADERLVDRLKAPAMALVKFPEIRAPRDVIFLHRSIGGLYALGRKLGIEMDFGAALRTAATHAVKVAAGQA